MLYFVSAIKKLMASVVGESRKGKMVNFTFFLLRKTEELLFVVSFHSKFHIRISIVVGEIFLHSRWENSRL